jgi:hypothetical protein
MDFLTKNITIEVPPKVVYEALRETNDSPRLKQYFNDLDQGSFKTELVKYVPNEELIFSGSNLSIKAQWRYGIRPVADFSEITITIDFKANTAKFLPFGIEKATAQTMMADTISGLFLLEKGYKINGQSSKTPRSNPS